MLQRPRRNRKNKAIRELIAENKVTLGDLIFPLFLVDDQKAKIPIQAMPGIFRYGPQPVLKEIEACLKLGLTNFAPFPVIGQHLKDTHATTSKDANGFYANSIRAIKKAFPEVTLVTDVAMDPYSSDGHDGLVQNGEILNDETLSILGDMALAQAQAGADIIAPSDMMDGRVAFIRRTLDQAGYTNVSIMSYTAKYASAFYGPFRDALDSAPKAGDKKTYQMDAANSREALREVALDQAEGADIVMVKPGLPYLDIVSALRTATHLPVAVYNVSGEYAMVKAAAANNWVDGDLVRDETLLSFKRAGADIILTYFAKEFALSQK